MATDCLAIPDLQHNEQPGRLSDIETRYQYLAIGTFNFEPTPELFKQWLPTELPAVLKIYLAGKMDQIWYGEDGKGVVFVMTPETSEEAASLLKSLLLGEADLLRFELIRIGSLVPLGSRIA